MELRNEKSTPHSQTITDNFKKHTQIMKKYFYSNGQEKNGPFSFEELKNEEINPDTLIWFEGLGDWTPIKYIKELEDILHLSPPPIPSNEIISIPTNNQSDEKFEDSVNYGEQKETFKHKRQGLFSRPFSFEGRIRRTEYGISFIISVILISILNVLLQEEELALLWFAYIPLYWFLFAQGSKRCHDMGYSGWWQLIPFYAIWMIFSKAEPGIQNKYGVNPKL